MFIDQECWHTHKEYFFDSLCFSGNAKKKKIRIRYISNAHVCYIDTNMCTYYTIYNTQYR